MTAVYLCPTFGVGYQSFTNGGLPNNLGYIHTYIAGGTTPQGTYTTVDGDVLNDNPITLTASGRTPSEIWLIAGQTYRFDLYDADDNLLKSYDDIGGGTVVNTNSVQDQTYTAFPTTGTSTAYVLTPVPPTTGNTANQAFYITFDEASGASPTLAVSGNAPSDLVYFDATGNKVNVGAGDIPAGWSSYVVFDGTDWVVLNMPLKALTETQTAYLSGNVSLSNISNYFDGPSLTVDATGTYFVVGTVCVEDSTQNAGIYVRITDGTTVFNSLNFVTVGANNNMAGTISAKVVTPVGGVIKIQARDATTTGGTMTFNETGNGKDCNITATRVG